jgi:hypothetical protein
LKGIYTPCSRGWGTNRAVVRKARYGTVTFHFLSSLSALELRLATLPARFTN